VAKHRLIYSLLRLRLPLRVDHGGQEEAIAFDFMEDVSGVERVMTGHDQGIITINIEEADEAERYVTSSTWGAVPDFAGAFPA